MNTMSPTDPRMRLARELLPREERDKITTSIKCFGDEADLYGQCPEMTLLVNEFNFGVAHLFKEAETTVRAILETPVFEKFVEFSLRHSSPIGKDLNEVLINWKTPYLGVSLWSFNPGNNRNVSLVFATNKKLLVCTDMYQHRGEHNSDFHWRHADSAPDKYGSGVLKADSYRLMVALRVLANPEAAWKYLRARAFVSEAID